MVISKSEVSNRTEQFALASGGFVARRCVNYREQSYPGWRKNAAGRRQQEETGPYSFAATATDHSCIDPGATDFPASKSGSRPAGALQAAGATLPAEVVAW
jgi:hypothetical protein